MKKEKLAIKMNNNIKRGCFLSRAWIRRKKAIAQRVEKIADLNRQKSAKRRLGY